MDLLALVRRLRRDYLDDLGGDTPTPDGWVTDDGNCRWKNDQLVDFLNTSVAVYHRITRLMDSDISAGAVSIALVSDQAVYPIPDHVMSIERMRLASWADNGRVLRNIAHRQIDDDRMFRADSPISAYQTDLHNRTFRLWGTPQDDDVPDTLIAQVHRLATAAMTWDGASSNLQTPDSVPVMDHHRLLPYAAYLAYSVVDAEADVTWPEMAGHWLNVHRLEVGEPVAAWLAAWREQNTANRTNRAKPFGLT